MSTEEKGKSHATTWIITLVAVLVVYVGSYGAVQALYGLRRLPQPAPEWLKVTFAPLTWLHRNSPLKKPFDAYIWWWAKVLDKNGTIPPAFW